MGKPTSKPKEKVVKQLRRHDGRVLLKRPSGMGRNTFRDLAWIFSYEIREGIWENGQMDTGWQGYAARRKARQAAAQENSENSSEKA